MRIFLTRIKIDKEEIDAIAENLYKKRFTDMFDVQFTIDDIKKEAAKEAMMKGREEGKIEGKEEARKEYAVETERKLKETAKKFLKSGVAVKIVSNCTGLDEDFLEELKQQDM
jgi:predicted transposase YdaD